MKLLLRLSREERFGIAQASDIAVVYLVLFHFCLDTKVEQKVKQETMYSPFLAFALIKLLCYCSFSNRSSLYIVEILCKT